MRKVLLIQPPVDETLPNTYRISLGLPYIAAQMREDLSIKLTTVIKILDLPIERKCDPTFNLENFLHSQGPFDIIGISIVSPAFNASIMIAKTIKRLYPESIVVAGGYHPTACPSEVLDKDVFDIVVLGEGEKTFTQIVSSDNLTHDLPLIKGICFKNKKDKIIFTPPQSLVENLDELPFPAFDLMPIDKYPPYILGVKSKKYLPLISSRGCPYGCIHCSKAIFGRRVRFRSPDNIVTEIEHLIETYGIYDFYFQDDTFTLIPERIERFCDLIIEKNLDIKWWCLTRTDAITEPLIKKMCQAGCIELIFGIESADPVVIEAINKGIDIEQSIEVIRCVRKYGIKSRVFFIVGLPKQDEESIQKNVEFLRKVRPDVVSVAPLVPYPGSEIKERADELGIKINTPSTPEGLVHYQEIFHPSDLNDQNAKIVIETEWMTKKQIIASIDKMNVAVVEIRFEEVLERIWDLSLTDAKSALN